jgi:DNA-binding IclR family transcriptional regulator
MSERKLDHLRILEAVAGEPRSMSASELAAAAELPKATAYRLLDDLVEAGWLISTGRPQRFRASLRVAALGIMALKRNFVRDVVLSNAIALAQTTGHRCMIAFYENGEVVYTDSVEVLGDRIMPALYGERAPAASTSAGKVLLAAQPPEEIDRVVARGLPRLASRTLTDPAQIRMEIEMAGTRGYAISDGEYTDLASGISAPVYDSTGMAVAALGITGPSPLTESFLPAVLRPLLGFATKASIELGAVRGDRIPT